MYLRIDHANGYIEEKNGNKYLIFDSDDENKELLKKYTDVWNGIKNKIQFNSNDNLPLSKTIKISFNDYNYSVCF